MGRIHDGPIGWLTKCKSRVSFSLADILISDKFIRAVQRSGLKDIKLEPSKHYIDMSVSGEQKGAQVMKCKVFPHIMVCDLITDPAAAKLPSL